MFIFTDNLLRAGNMGAVTSSCNPPTAFVLVLPEYLPWKVP